MIGVIKSLKDSRQSGLKNSPENHPSTTVGRNYKRSANKLTFLLMLSLFLIAAVSLYPSTPVSTSTIKQADDSTPLDQKATAATAQDTQSSSNTSNNSSTTVSVNGQSIKVPANGSINETINSGDSNTTVELKNSSSDSGSSNNNSVNLQVTSNSSTSSSSSEVQQ